LDIAAYKTAAKGVNEGQVVFDQRGKMLL